VGETCFHRKPAAVLKITATEDLPWQFVDSATKLPVAEPL
jgi:hypothetical protein